LVKVTVSVIFRVRLRAGIPVLLYGYDDRTATGRKNSYVLPVLYTLFRVEN